MRRGDYHPAVVFGKVIIYEAAFDFGRAKERGHERGIVSAGWEAS